METRSVGYPRPASRLATGQKQAEIHAGRAGSTAMSRSRCATAAACSGYGFVGRAGSVLVLYVVCKTLMSLMMVFPRSFRASTWTQGALRRCLRMPHHARGRRGAGRAGPKDQASHQPWPRLRQDLGRENEVGILVELWTMSSGCERMALGV